MRFPPTLVRNRCLKFLFQNQQHLFCCPLIFKEYLNPQVRINKMTKTVSIPTLVLQKEPQGS